ncbi:sigma-70 family RNA polymerase sigma factor [Heliorestis acidaminivorans]|uniref:RNA polymerase sigma factor n=1 Tax=Heliorestis acidaminivorans TaxID=553427 RepID=A0A6I0EWF5_9FIRM|nr:sigma-70 family RNA polymerase sigma factor [Heliorestis acidaminivorans]
MRLLVQQAQKGDRQAFEKLVTMYQDRVYALSYRMAGNPDDAQDLAQEAFIRAYSSLASFRQDADFGTWIHRITVNTWINMQRKNKRATVVSLDEPMHTSDGEVQRELAATSEGPEEFVERRETSDRIRQALLELKPEHRAVIVLREMQGYSYEEVAEMLDCTLGTVKSRINRARNALKEKLLSLAPSTGMGLTHKKSKSTRQGGEGI